MAARTEDEKATRDSVKELEGWIAFTGAARLFNVTRMAIFEWAFKFKYWELDEVRFVWREGRKAYMIRTSAISPYLAPGTLMINGELATGEHYVEIPEGSREKVPPQLVQKAKERAEAAARYRRPPAPKAKAVRQRAR